MKSLLILTGLLLTGCVSTSAVPVHKDYLTMEIEHQNKLQYISTLLICESFYRVQGKVYEQYLFSQKVKSLVDSQTLSVKDKSDIKDYYLKYIDLPVKSIHKVCTQTLSKMSQSL